MRRLLLLSAWVLGLAACAGEPSPAPRAPAIRPSPPPPTPAPWPTRPHLRVAATVGLGASATVTVDAVDLETYAYDKVGNIDAGDVVQAESAGAPPPRATSSTPPRYPTSLAIRRPTSGNKGPFSVGISFLATPVPNVVASSER